ncbi:MAG: hypothetical protein M3070_05035 [Actinomycetota bacterium]|nr:hypothetical protein [Actinomycetota bacterium]
MAGNESTGPVPGQLRAAAVLLAVEALALLAAAAVLVLKTLTGHPNLVGRALFGAAFAAAGAIALAFGARGLLRLRPPARTPIIVLQLLALPVSYSLAFQAGRVEYGGPILLVALSVLYLLFTPPARAALDREPS